MDISALRERSTPSEVTVTELNSYIKGLFDNNRTLNAISVRGEISNFTYHRSGHLYFTLKDEGAQVKAVMFRSSAASLKFMPENGMKVIVRCSVSVYVQGGAYQLYVSSMQPDGIGALYLAYEQLKSRLSAEGLFSEENKQQLPQVPTKIGVITSPTGAAVRDIINVLGRRFPLATVYLYPALVQGEGAEDNLISGIDYFDKSGLADLIIIGRGGGSIEDLWAFNGERLARRIFECRIPVISAVGHETDFTICDFVADLRAPTPSAAAELAVPDIRELLLKLDTVTDRCIAALDRTVERQNTRLSKLLDSSLLSKPGKIFELFDEKLSELYGNACTAVDKQITDAALRLVLASGKADSLSPLSVLSRGYSVISKNGAILKSVEELSIGDNLNIRLSDGSVSAEVKGKD